MTTGWRLPGLYVVLVGRDRRCCRAPAAPWSWTTRVCAGGGRVTVGPQPGPARRLPAAGVRGGRRGPSGARPSAQGLRRAAALTVAPRLEELASCALRRRPARSRRRAAAAAHTRRVGAPRHPPAHAGEPLNRVDWKSTAKTGNLMLREMEADTEDDLTCCWTAGRRRPARRGPHGPAARSRRTSAFEAAVVAAGSMAAFTLRAGHAVSLLLPDGRLARPAAHAGRRQPAPAAGRARRSRASGPGPARAVSAGDPRRSRRRAPAHRSLLVTSRVDDDLVHALAGCDGRAPRSPWCTFSRPARRGPGEPPRSWTSPRPPGYGGRRAATCPWSPAATCARRSPPSGRRGGIRGRVALGRPADAHGARRHDPAVPAHAGVFPRADATTALVAGRLVQPHVTRLLVGDGRRWRRLPARPASSAGAPGRSPCSCCPLGAYLLSRLLIPLPVGAGRRVCPDRPSTHTRSRRERPRTRTRRSRSTSTSASLRLVLSLVRVRADLAGVVPRLERPPAAPRRRRPALRVGFRLHDGRDGAHPPSGHRVRRAGRRPAGAFAAAGTRPRETVERRGRGPHGDGRRTARAVDSRRDYRGGRQPAGGLALLGALQPPGGDARLRLDAELPETAVQGERRCRHGGPFAGRVLLARERAVGVQRQSLAQHPRLGPAPGDGTRWVVDLRHPAGTAQHAGAHRARAVRGPQHLHRPPLRGRHPAGPEDVTAAGPGRRATPEPSPSTRRADRR